MYLWTFQQRPISRTFKNKFLSVCQSTIVLVSVYTQNLPYISSCLCPDTTVGGGTSQQSHRARKFQSWTRSSGSLLEHWSERDVVSEISRWTSTARDNHEASCQDGPGRGGPGRLARRSTQGGKHRWVRRQSTKSRYQASLGLSFARKFNIKAYEMCVAHSMPLMNAIIIIITLLRSWWSL